MVSDEHAAEFRKTIEQIYELLKKGSREDVGQAMALCRNLSAEGNLDTGDDLPLAMFQTGQHAEGYFGPEEYRDLYEGALTRPVENPQIHAGCHFRLAQIQQNEGDLWGATESYEAAIKDGTGWEEMTMFARYRLAHLLVAAEEYGRAESLLREIQAAAPNPFFTSADANLLHARCLIMEGASEKAAHLLQPLATATDSPPSLEANRLLAEIREASGDREAAVVCYRAILASPFADTKLKAAVAYRMDALER